ncbi:MAG: helicase-associated domain-containing protein [Acidobacteriota bacterium]|nr:helicase-associated domain-containing protein [Acidobacteriota bacterium]
MSRLTVYPTLDEYESRLPDFAKRLEGINADKLKKMARVWVGKDAAKLNKDSAIQLLKRSFRDPKAIRQLADNLTPVERDGLMLMKLRGRSVVYTEELATELLLLHPITPDRRSSYHSSGKQYGRLNEMMERGLLMRCDGSNSIFGDSHYSYSDSCEAVGAVADFFGVIDLTPPPALSLKPVTDVVAPVARRTGELLLELTSFAQAFDRLGSVQIIGKGLYANPSLAKLYKLLDWNRQDEDSRAPSLLPSVEFYLGLFLAADLLKVDYVARKITTNPHRNIPLTLEQPLTIQARLWAQSYRALRRWVECVPPGVYFYADENTGQTRFNGLRAALLLALGLLPDPNQWYRITDLSEILRLRIGRQFALGHVPSYYVPWKATPEQEAQALAKYEKEYLTNWQSREQVWIEQALCGSLFHLGLVELASDAKDKSGQQTLFRLTEAGRAALYDIFRQPVETDSQSSPARPSEQACWIVQPNFEVLVYLDQASPRQLGFIERIGQRQKADAAVVTYRLARESVYIALEKGVETNGLLQTLESGSLHPLPPGVARTLSDWAARRERLTVRLDASVLEFADAAARDAALNAGKIKGTAIGERFLLTNKTEQELKRAAPFGGTISYEPQPPRSLIVQDDGKILITQHDLLIAGELSAFAEPTSNPMFWQVTRASVLAARDRGWTASDIINRISHRATLTSPPFLQYAIHAWCGNKTAPGPTTIATPPLLQTSTAEVAEAICKCTFLRPHLLARIGGCAVLIKPESVKTLGKLLAEYGFAIGKEVLLPTPESPEKKK